jgi:hypothetical protein
MARMARSEVFAPDEVAVVHVMNRVVRRCYLLGNDPVSGKNYDHRKVMIELQLQRLAGALWIDLLGFAIMLNHFHLILRSRPDAVSTWDDTEVARRWLLICPVRKNSAGDPGETGTGSVRGACTCFSRIPFPPRRGIPRNRMSLNSIRSGMIPENLKSSDCD